MPAGAPEVLAQFTLTPGQAAGWTLFAVLALGTFLEPPLLAFAQGRRARPMMLAGLAGMGLVCLVAALAPSYGVLLAALLFYGPASGVGVHLAEAALMTARPHDREATLARWMLAGLIGDLLGPAAIAASVFLGYGVRGALLAAAAIAFAQTWVAYRAHADIEEDDEEEEHVPLAAAVREAFACRPLLGWSLVTLVCALLDELLVAFGALHLEANLGATPSQRAVTFAAWVMGGVVGTVLLERLGPKASTNRLLWLTGVGSGLGYLLWLVAPGWASATAALAVSGMFSAAHYPLLTARTYAALPHRPSTVAALNSFVGLLDIFPPLLIAWVADTTSVWVAVAVLGLQPVGVMIAAALSARAAHRAGR